MDVFSILTRYDRVRTMVSGHLHQNHLFVEQGIPCFSVQSMVEENNVPEPGVPALATSILEITDNYVSINVRGNDPLKLRWEYSKSLNLDSRPR